MNVHFLVCVGNSWVPVGISSHQSTTTGLCLGSGTVGVILVLALCRMLCQATAGEKSFIFLLLMSFWWGTGELQAECTRGHSEPCSSRDYPGFHREPLVCSVSSVNINIKSNPGLAQLLAFAVSRPCVTWTRKSYRWQSATARKMWNQSMLECRASIQLLCLTGAACSGKANSCLLHIHCHISLQSVSIPVMWSLSSPPSFLLPQFLLTDTFW